MAERVYFPKLDRSIDTDWVSEARVTKRDDKGNVTSLLLVISNDHLNVTDAGDIENALTAFPEIDNPKEVTA